MTASVTNDMHAEWEERAAIIEYDGGIERKLAEMLAAQRIARKYDIDENMIEALVRQLRNRRA